ncbi:MAG: hypothetical protein ACD_77C00088G0012, partial [uncultured bacterium]
MHHIYLLKLAPLKNRCGNRIMPVPISCRFPLAVFLYAPLTKQVPNAP